MIIIYRVILRKWVQWQDLGSSEIICALFIVSISFRLTAKDCPDNFVIRKTNCIVYYVRKKYANHG